MQPLVIAARRNPVRLALIALCLLAAGCAGGPAPREAATDWPESRRAIAAAMSADSIPAMTVAVYRGDELAWEAAFGLADLEQRIPAEPRTRFRLGSVSKLFTATLAVRLAAQGRIDLDAPVRGYLPQWPEKHPPVTLRQLLGHLGGIRHYTSADFDRSAPGGMIDQRFYADAAAILEIFADDELVAPPGERFHYTTFGYSLAGLAIEAATGEDFATLLGREVLDAGGIDDILVDRMFEIVPWRAENYDPIDNYLGFLPESYGPVVNALPLNSAYKVPGGGMVGDAAAVAKFGTLHYAPGFLDAHWFRETFTSQRNAAGEATGTGLGWRVATDDAGRAYFHHSGSQQGSRAFLLVYPAERLSIALLSNLGGRPRDIDELGRAVAREFLAAR